MNAEKKLDDPMGKDAWETHTVTIEKLVFGGEGLCHVAGRSVFVPGSLPGETLEITLEKGKRNYSRGKIERILVPSPHRVSPACEYYGVCGGCDFMHISLEKERELKKEIYLSLMRHEKVPLETVSVIAGEPLGYRARITLSRDGSFHKKKSCELVKVGRCLVATPEVNAFLESAFRDNGMGNMLGSERMKTRERFNVFGSRYVVPNDPSTKTPDTHLKVIAESESDCPNSVSIHKKLRGGNLEKSRLKHQKKFYSGSIISEENMVTLLLSGRKVSFDVRGFFQANIEMLLEVISVLTERMSGDSLLDCYSGCGVFTLFLLERFENFTLIEHNRDALLFSKLNIDRYVAEKGLENKTVEYVGLSGENWAKESDARKKMFDTLLIDPPRSGIEKGVLSLIIEKKIKHIFYLSCNISTQARDIQGLISAGYVIEEAFLFDFFPKTSDMESLVILNYNGK